MEEVNFFSILWPNINSIFEDSVHRNILNGKRVVGLLIIGNIRPPRRVLISI